MTKIYAPPDTDVDQARETLRAVFSPRTNVTSPRLHGPLRLPDLTETRSFPSALVTSASRSPGTRFLAVMAMSFAESALLQTF